jgi:hypothetical protein
MSVIVVSSYHENWSHNKIVIDIPKLKEYSGVMKLGFIMAFIQDSTNNNFS